MPYVPQALDRRSRDGTSQSNRALPALDPRSAPLDGRSVSDLLAFTRAYATHLAYVDDAGRRVGDWRGFCPDVDVAELAAFIEEPTALVPAHIARLAVRPHFALFAAFLRLYRHAQRQLDELTGRHLDLYYRDVLGMTQRPAVPDRLHVYFDLAPGRNTIRLEQGTALVGEDAAGPVVYRTDRPVLVSRASVAALRSVYVDQRVVDFAAARLRPGADSSSRPPMEALLAMLALALGDPAPGDPMPRWQWSDGASASVDEALVASLLADVRSAPGILGMSLEELRSLNELRRRGAWGSVNALLGAAASGLGGNATLELSGDAFYDNVEAALGAVARTVMQTLDSLEAYFHMSVFDFERLVSAADVELGAVVDWDRVTPILADAHAEKVYAGRRERLRQAGDLAGGGEERIDAVVRVALGADLASAGQTPAERLERLGGFASDTALASWRSLRAKAAAGEAIEDREWTEFFSSVEIAQRAREQLPRPVAEYAEWRNLYAYQDATALAARPDRDDQTSQWKTFGRPRDASEEVVPAQTVGWAVSSPLLALQEGLRTMTLTVAFDAGSFDASQVDDAVLDEAPFGLQITTEDGWFDLGRLRPETVSYEPSSGDALPALRFTATLGVGEPATRAPESEVHGMDAPWPVLRLVLRQYGEPATGAPRMRYQEFAGLRVAFAHVVVDAVGMTALQMRNDRSKVDPAKPCLPFGAQPAVGSRLYVGHPELAIKPLTSVSLALTWMGLPDVGLSEHYRSYRVRLSEEGGGWSETPTFDSFRALVALVDNQSEGVSATLPLFKGDAEAEQTLGFEGIPWRPAPAASVPTSKNVLDWPRYVRVELRNQDFLHRKYPAVAGKKAAQLAARVAAGATEIEADEYHVNPPYTPTLAGLRLAYCAAAEIAVPPHDASAPHRMFHVHPFGARPLAVDAEEEARFLPAYDYRGELHIGLRDVVAPQQLSLLFQLADGSADPDLEPAPVAWSYLDGDRWRILQDGSIHADTTRGLTNSGIVELALPAVAKAVGTTDLYWIRVATTGDPRGVCDAIAVHPHGVSATLDAGDGGAPDAHYLQPLPPGSIKGLAVPNPKVSEVHQPYTSIGGRPSERAGTFNARVAERLRHKNRAISSWDYERLVLQEFPDIYKVKCVPAQEATARSPGAVSVVVIPDIRGKLPFDPFAPKASTELLGAIRDFLRTKAPHHSVVDVRNAHYVPILVQCVVRFKPDWDVGFSKAELQRELSRFLSPWAYDEGAEVTIGGRLFANSIVDFIDRRQYVDYVAGITLFKSEDGGDSFSRVDDVAGQDYYVGTERPDGVLIAARQHDVYAITDVAQGPESFTGINYMRVEIDFFVE